MDTSADKTNFCYKTKVVTTISEKPTLSSPAAFFFLGFVFTAKRFLHPTPIFFFYKTYSLSPFFLLLLNFFFFLITAQFLRKTI
jgi:hypothetical protein